ncbi:MAG: zinc ABC transporter ATP-binding protein ZnuC [Gammaproteobacteria bacterium]|nr:zinc ABC transporter ATP-binding protein ZnuC [Gammaproteobacteria bacterium]NKB65201.1 zinc ABC transporter ATP-binding protein ZnuC [Gammaproteobacteria bacterium]
METSGSKSNIDPPLLSLHGISVKKESDFLIENIALAVQQGEILTIVGPNGAGKSTLVKVALGLIKPETGHVQSIQNLRIGYVPQNVDIDETFPITVERFLRLGHKYSLQQLLITLKKVNADALLDSPLQAISGGELRRVLLARALLKKPQLLILDEPTAGVDVAGQAEIFTLIKSIRDQQNCGVLLISHDLHIVMAGTDRVVCLNRHLCCSGTPEHVQQHPEFIALFGQSHANKFAIYAHHHDHTHDLHGRILHDHELHAHSPHAHPSHEHHSHTDQPHQSQTNKSHPNGNHPSRNHHG